MKNNIKFVNLTKHKVSIRHNGLRIDIPPSGQEFRLKMREETVDIVDGIYVIMNSCVNLHEIPPAKPGVIYITSFRAMREARRSDVMAPGRKNRKHGGIVACTDLACIVYED